MRTTKAKISILAAVLTALTLLIACGAILLFAPAQGVADAAEVERIVIQAKVTNLMGNEYAVKSNVKIARLKESMEIDKFFYIPESYYVELRERIFESNYYTGKYGDLNVIYELEGELPDPTPFKEDEKLYPELTLCLAEGASATVEDRDVLEDDKINFLGYSEDGAQIYCSVSTSQNQTYYGFIPRESLKTFDVPYQAREQEKRNINIAEQNKPAESEGIQSDGNIAPNTSLALRIVLIIGICVPAVLIMVLLFKPSKDEVKTRGRRKNDSEVDYDNR